MRAWGNRPDTSVCDEPFYAHYLLKTGLDHPGREEVIGHHETDWRKVIIGLTGPVPGGKRIYYQKHMAHHLLPEIDRGFLRQLTHCLLIRHPAEMLTSLSKVLPNPRLADTGLPQQLEILQSIQDSTGVAPPIIDARDVLVNPRESLELLCHALGVEFSASMLSWPAGRRNTNGIWAKYWYSAVESSTGFEAYRPMQMPMPEYLQPLFEECLCCYEKLHAQRLGR